MEIIDVTPEDSVVPVFIEQKDPKEVADLQKELDAVSTQLKAQKDARQSALAKLAALGLTEEEIGAL
jgi:hypothetical protein